VPYCIPCLLPEPWGKWHQAKGKDILLPVYGGVKIKLCLVYNKITKEAGNYG